jgi:glycosyltransferase involved in cell wall biosynthesis
MKILMVNKFLYPNGGSETYIFKLGDYLKSQGHEVEYFGMEHEDRVVGNSINSYTSNMNFHTSKMEKLLYPIKIIYSKEARKKIRIVLDNFKPDVVHLNNFNFQLTPSIIYEIKKYEKQTTRKVKIVFTAHDYQLICPNHMMNNPCTRENCEKCVGGNFVNCIKGKCIHGSTVKSTIGAIEGYLYKSLKTYKSIDSIICPSKFLANKMNTNNLFKDKTVVLHNFIDEVSWKDIDKENYVLYFGRFSEEKGIKTLIEVCRVLPEIQFIFAGSGPLENEIEKISNIKNVGFKNGKELEELIRKAKFSIYPSEWYENCPFSVMESQMYGTPVLGANIGGVPELIQVNKTGELFESGNSNELKAKIENLWKDKELIDSYSKNCKYIEFDTIEEYYKKIIKLYKK